MANSRDIQVWILRRGLPAVLSLLLVTLIAWQLSVDGQTRAQAIAWQQLLESPAEELEGRLEGLLRSSRNPGSDLAKAIASPRPELSLVALELLKQRLDRWRAEPAEAYRQPLVQCVTLLGAQAENLSPEVVHLLAAALQPVHRWRLGLTTAEEMRFTVALESIARQAMLVDREAALATAMAWPAEPRENPQWSPRPWEHPTVASSADLPLPLTPLPPKELPESLSGNEHRLAADSPQPNGEASIGPPDRLPDLFATAATAPQPIQKETPGSLATASPLARAPLVQIVWQLRSARPEEVVAAERELRRRGFEDRHLELALEVTAPDALARTEVVRRIPTMPGIQATAWLYLMTKDPDETVRYLATSTLLTSRDPRLHRQIRGELATDPSPKVRELLTR